MGGSEKNPLKRLGFKRTNTGDVPTTTTTELSEFESNGESSNVGRKLSAEFAGNVKHDHSTTAKDITEAEANRKLRAFRADHHFDPNLPDVAVGIVEDATRRHSLKDEAALVDELVEESPYPEVRDDTDRNCILSILTHTSGPSCRPQLR